MSDVMKAIRRIESKYQDVETLHGILPRPQDHKSAFRAVRSDFNNTAEAKWPTIHDHIGELHSAIARLKGELDKDPDFVCSTFTQVAFADLFDLLPTDWAGETE